jgi:fatty acid desaturase
METKCIKTLIHSSEQRLRKRYSWLKYQDFIGISIFLSSLITIAASIFLYINSLMSSFIIIPLIGLLTSILHELEHDLIHNLYFKSYKAIQHMMFFIIWIAKGSISPWYRKTIHLRHHNHSGSQYDIEERLIGIGEPLGFKRILASTYTLGSMFYFNKIKKDNSSFSPLRLFLSSMLVILPSTILLHLYQVSLLFGYDWYYVKTITVCWILPNILRQTCLNIIATYSHYYGDIPPNDVRYQNQILDHWSVFILNLFCFNFGSTHIIHHYVANQPFYIRQMISKDIIRQMINNGTRHNDFDIIKNKNRYSNTHNEKDNLMIGA